MDPVWLASCRPCVPLHGGWLSAAGVNRAFPVDHGTLCGENAR